MGLKTWLTKATLNAMVMSPALGHPSLMPRPIARVKRVWCSEQHFFSHEVGPISDLRSPIRLQKTELYLRDISNCILNQIRSNESVSCSKVL